MNLIAYTSEYKGEASDIDTALKQISETAKINNPKLDITGLLFYHNGMFIQFIEGERDSLESLYSKLQDDPRHSNLTRIVDDEIKERSFSEWNMDSFNLNENAQLDNDILKSIRDTYKENFETKSDSMVNVFRELLEAHFFTDDTEAL